MERGFYNEDIEELLKEKADQYKMYPSDKVWKGIHRSLHPNRKWYWFSLILFLSAVGYYTFIEFITPSTATKSISGNASSSVAKPTETTEDNTPKAVIVPFGNPNKQAGNTTGNSTKQRTFVLNPDNSDDNTGVILHMDQPVVASTVTSQTPIAETNTMAFNNETPVYNLHDWKSQKVWQHEPADNPLLLVDNPVEHTAQQTAQVPAASLIDPTSVDESKLVANTQDEAEDSKRLNWLTNNAVYELAVPKQKRLSWQISFTPTMNYRTLKESNYPSDVKTTVPVPQADNIPGNLNQLVNHKPALGFELGSNILYAVNKTVTLKTGLLFNYTRYDIQAYSTSTSEPAVIALTSAYGIATGQMTSYTRYRNFGGEAVDNLKNQYYQLSVPLGLELNLLGNEKLQVGIAGTVQPTFLLNRNTYLITADYKYATEPSLVRRWNINTSAEAFISYKTGDLKWQVGPQLRYQLLSSYIKEYPIREHLFEYGIKIAVAKTIR